MKTNHKLLLWSNQRTNNQRNIHTTTLQFLPTAVETPRKKRHRGPRGWKLWFYQERLWETCSSIVPEWWRTFGEWSCHFWTLVGGNRWSKAPSIDSSQGAKLKNKDGNSTRSQNWQERYQTRRWNQIRLVLCNMQVRIEPQETEANINRNMRPLINTCKLWFQ